MTPHSMASSVEKTPTPWVRTVKIPFRITSLSYSIKRGGKYLTKLRTKASQPFGKSSATPPMQN